MAGSREFDRWLGARLADLATDVRRALGSNLVALVLGGGYGRGEGAVVGAPGPERPYNDLDLVIVVRDRSGVTRRLSPVSRHHEERLGIAVDFSRPLTTRDIERWEHRLRWHELYHGHVVLAGDPEVVLRHAPPCIAAPVPPSEASRLLLNRGAGLVWSLRVMGGREASPDPDFVRRNSYKALLAVGDAYLISGGIFAPHHRGRYELLRAFTQRLPGDQAAPLLARYAEALAFKFTPDRLPSAPAPAGLVASAVELWSRAFLDIESGRHGRGWQSLADYASWRGQREPQRATRWIRNLVSNLRYGLFSALSPREPLYRQLPELLAGAGTGPAWDRRSAEFLRVWRAVND